VTAKADLGASVMARLLNRAKKTGDDYQTLLTAIAWGFRHSGIGSC
jgi:hypothetical protein